MTDSITRYRAKSKQGALEAVDFSTVAGKRLAFFELRDAARLEDLKQLLTTSSLSETLMVTTPVSGKTVLVTQGDAPASAVLDALAKHGETLQKEKPSKSIDPWKIRSIFGFGGQTLQLTSAFLRPPNAAHKGASVWKNIDVSIFVFAATNLAANIINLVYHHGEQVEDIHQERYLKERMNRDLAPHLVKGKSPLDVNDDRELLRTREESNKPLDKAKDFLERHSVEVGELGLRYLGAAGLAFPATGWKRAFMERKMPAPHSSALRVYAGVSSIFGKTVALTSAIPDPYNPKPPSLFDKVREKFSFLAGGLIEITSFSALAYDCIFRTKGTKNGIIVNGRNHRDWLGGIGATMFVMGYIVRSWAKFGERNVNMDELYAHASDTLAATPPEKMPQLLANTAASLAEHFKDKPELNFATIYTNMANDLVQFHLLSKQSESLINKEKNNVVVPIKAAAKARKRVPESHIAAEGALVQPLVQRNTLAMR